MNSTRILRATVLALAISFGSPLLPSVAWADGNPLAPAAAAAPFDGSFSGDGVTLVLKLDAASAQYGGTLEFKGQKYPCSATGTNNALQGKFKVGNDLYDFSADLNGGQLNLTSAGQTYKLAKQGDVNAVNPLTNKPPVNPLTNPPAVNPAPAGVGITVTKNAQNNLVIDKVLPGGGAEKAGIKPGWVMLAIDGQAIRNMSGDQVRAALAGEPGSIVKVTFDTPTELIDALIERKALSAGPAVNPAPINPAPVNPGPVPPGPVVNNNGPAGIGILIKKNNDDDLVIDQVVPGGGAAKAGIKPGWVLVAIEGKDVENMSMDQIRQALGGQAGTTVKVTFDTPTEIIDAIIERKPLPPPPAPTPNVNPGINNPGMNNPGVQPLPPAQNIPAFPGGQIPAPVPPGNVNVNPGGQQFPGGTVTNPALANASAPDWMKPGMRVSWYMSSASIPGARAVLTPDPEGNWVDPQGNRFSSQNTASSSGQGILQSTITNMGRDSCTSAAKNWLLDPTSNSCTSIGSMAVVVNFNEGSEMWQSPAKLATLRDVPTGDVRIMHMDYPLDGRTYHAVRIQTKVQGGWTQNTYDTATGLLIVGSTALQGGPVQVAGPNGTATTSDGVMNLSYTKFVGVREVKVPWMNSEAPQQVRGLRQISFKGVQANEVQNAGGVKWPMTMDWTINRFDPTLCLARVAISIDYGNGAPNQPGVSDRAIPVSEVWIDPQILQQLRPNQVLDEDPVTKSRLWVANVQNGQISIGSQTATETAIGIYDLRTGLVAGGMLQTKNGIGTTTIQLQVTGQQ